MSDSYMISDSESGMLKDLYTIETSNKPTDPHFSMALCLANSVLSKNTLQNKEEINIDKIESMTYDNINNFVDHPPQRVLLFQELGTNESTLFEYDGNMNMGHINMINSQNSNQKLNILCDKEYHENIKSQKKGEKYYTFDPYNEDTLFSENESSHPEIRDDLNIKNEVNFEGFGYCCTPISYQCTSTNCFIIPDTEIEDDKIIYEENK